MAGWRASGVGESGGARSTEITDEQRQSLVRYYGFDKPLVVRYFHWLSRLGHLDLGDSYYYGEPVAPILGRALLVTLLMAAITFSWLYLIAVPLGVWQAARHGTRLELLAGVATFGLYAIPTFAFALILIVLFGGGSGLRLFPISGLTSDNFSDLSHSAQMLDVSRHLVLPIASYVIVNYASVSFLIKNTMLEELKRDYITTARAKGLSEFHVVVDHALRNALLPVAHGLGQRLSIFFTEVLLVESIFNIQGIGRLTFESIQHRDYPIVLAAILLLGIVYIAGNLFADFLYTLIDPRIDFG